MLVLLVGRAELEESVDVNEKTGPVGWLVGKETLEDIGEDDLVMSVVDGIDGTVSSDPDALDVTPGIVRVKFPVIDSVTVSI